jgi:hypothetical protein
MHPLADYIPSLVLVAAAFAIPSDRDFQGSIQEISKAIVSNEIVSTLEVDSPKRGIVGQTIDEEIRLAKNEVDFENNPAVVKIATNSFD